MQRGPAAPNADAYVAGLDGWRRACVEQLRRAVTSTGPFAETIKWGHLVYASNGPVLLIRAEDARVLFGLWRGQRLTGIEPRLKPGGNYEMATLTLREGDAPDLEVIARLAAEAHKLNAELGDPTRL
jgi:hypothetical protein